MASGNADGESLPQRVIGGGIAPHQFHCGPVILPWLTTLEWIGTQLPRSHLDLVRVTKGHISRIPNPRLRLEKSSPKKRELRFF
jgi:hypothetical protein